MTTDATNTTDAASKPPAPRKAPVKKAPAPRKAAPGKKSEFNPTVTDKGRLDHTNCGHPRDPKGRSACRAAYAKKN